MPKHTNLITDAELAELPQDVRGRFRHAAGWARNAVTLYDVGVARGILLSLKMDGRINKSTLDRMFKRVHGLIPPEILATIPPEQQADLGKGIIVPASMATRQAR